MSLYRIKQFYWSLTSNIDSNDKRLLNKYLEQEELNLFYKLSVCEQKHSVNVARSVKEYCSKNECDIDSQILIKAALMHDIGKITARLGIIEKSLLVILNKLTNGKIKKLSKIKKIDVYYNHGDKGYNLLKDYNYDECFLYLIKNHHNSNIIGDKRLNILIECDNKN